MSEVCDLGECCVLTLASDLVISVANHPPSPVLLQASLRDNGMGDGLDFMSTTYYGNVTTHRNFNYDNFIYMYVCVHIYKQIYKTIPPLIVCTHTHI